MLVLNETYEVVIRVPVKLTNVPANVVITTDIEDSVIVTLKDKGVHLLGYQDTSSLKPVYVDFKKYASDYHGIIPYSAIAKDINSRFEGSTIISAKPEKIEFFYNYGAHKKVPVLLAGKISPEGAYYLSQVKFWPDSVTIYATHQKLDSIDAISIKPVAINNFKDTLIMQTQLATTIGVKCVPSVVQMGLFPDIYIEESVSIPITCRNIPRGKKLRTFPSKATIHFVTGMKQYKELNLQDFVVEPDYDEIIQKPNKKKCTLRISTIPDCIQRAKLLTTEVDFIIEE